MLTSKYHVSTDSGLAILFYWGVLFISMVRAVMFQEQDMVHGLRAKDAIISDLKEQNMHLQQRVTDPQAEVGLSDQSC